MTKPRALAELGVDKRLIKSKKILSDLLAKEKAYRENENEADDDNDSNDSSDQEETASEQSQSESIDVESHSEPHHEQVIQKIPRKPVIIIKIGTCLHLRWLNAQAAFGTIIILFVPFVVTKFPLMPNM